MKYKIITLLFLVTGCISESFSQTGITIKLIEQDVVSKEVTQPRFPGGEDALHGFLIKNIRYPYILVRTDMEGEVDLKFAVDKEGNVEDVGVLKGFDPLADDEIIRVMKIMPKWIPAESDGEPIRADLRLNVQFNLNDELRGLAIQMKDSVDDYSYIEHPIVTENRIKSEELAAVKLHLDSAQRTGVEEVQPDPSLNRSPEFPGGNNALETYLKENMKYPKRAIKYGIEGRAIFNLQISSDGEISKIWIFKSLFPDCDEEAFFLIKKMPKWIPGLKNGEPASMEVMLPVAFVLPK